MNTVLRRDVRISDNDDSHRDHSTLDNGAN
jgi:hypothetical protein